MKLDLERDFAENTTLHGISRVFQSAGVVLKLFWSIIVISAFGLFVWQFADRITAYLKFNVNTLVEVEHKPALKFPAVTLCNYNRFSSSRIAEKYHKRLDTIFGFAETTHYYNYYSQSSWGDPETYSFFEDESFNFEVFTAESGFSLQQSLLRCDWKGKQNSCSAANFTAFFNPEYGICYTFGIDISQELSQNLPGSGGGLSLLIDINEEFYTEPYKEGNHEAGLKVLVHDKNDPSFALVDTHGLAVPPGFHTYLALRQTTFELLPEPYGKCKKHEDYYYSKAYCLVECRLNFIIKKCHCRPLGYPGNITLCSPEESVNCVGKAVQEYRSAEKRTCVCPSSCKETSFKSTPSMTVFPSDHLIADYLKDFPYRFGNYGTTDQIRKNLVYLDIFFDELSETKFKQVPAMTWSALLSDLGGQMGLFLGMSAITAAEVMEYVIRKIYRLFKGDQSNTRVIDISQA